MGRVQRTRPTLPRGKEEPQVPTNRRASTVRGGHGTYAHPQADPTLGRPQTTTEKTTAASSPGELPAPLLDDPPPSDPIKPLTTDEDTSMVPAYLGVPASTTPNVSSAAPAAAIPALNDETAGGGPA